MSTTEANSEFHLLARYTFHPSRAERLLWALDAVCRASGLKRHDCLIVVARLLTLILERWKAERAESASRMEPFERHLAQRLIATDWTPPPPTPADRPSQAHAAPKER